ncbi:MULTISPECIES: pyridoxal phosphate-dependent decarboxylase family protein [Streptomyces]|jgi:L-2,4-diaminobutyrate decarboxylase|uniref:Aminotransferase class I/II-fold pyridoxal phosphate-dependent enzyme n=1 Tax=Streptomyces mirabilis TaxID=68239 RepID=A0ABU3UVZ8_9ACTN|nr:MULTISPECIES: aminotransferase class I/II-fold pyridoxal phosphate-dependent enzyme [Streptomyces]MCX4608023.1 aminotransferase class I/II-fold pyridoxal phosphate-dependent enzyme [Streptomyces mirabilis]MCX5348488.1 aminotransferase class I/II-fold pyridoxal phosphate-dependent enzyme [Streptomyces mirabilis]MDU8998111.1 aminotransferase class I/II-fold pyridoxal phosphate-dependent enzyme [Streptomyces mirabilis]QDN87077.1 aminotransferase class I/II-fold pyridoxal phosphate-dependent enz
MSTPPLASGPEGPGALRPLLDTVLDALRDGGEARGGPLPAGGPEGVARRVRDAVGDVLPEQGTEDALHVLVRALAEGAADPAHPLCAAHLHCPPLAVATAADLAASALNPSMDSWDQAPAASELEALVTRALAQEIGADDALVTTGGTESNQLALLLAREAHAGVRLIHGANAHHSLPRAAWLLGLPDPVVVPAPAGTMDLAALDEALTELQGLRGSLLVAATAGTTDAGLIDPLPDIADLCEAHGTRLHIDAAYGGGLLFSDHHRGKLDGLDRAHTVTLDLHKLGWQPVAAGLLVVKDPHDLDALSHRADYLNADDDTEAGLPDLLGRSLRTTRRPDILKVAVTLKTLGRAGLGALVDQVCARAVELADLVEAHPGFELYDPPTLSTVLFRPAEASDEAVAAVRRTLLHEGRAVLGRALLDDRLWLKATLLNPHTRPGDLAALLKLVEGHTPR